MYLKGYTINCIVKEILFDNFDCIYVNGFFLKSCVYITIVMLSNAKNNISNVKFKPLTVLTTIIDIEV